MNYEDLKSSSLRSMFVFSILILLFASHASASLMLNYVGRHYQEVSVVGTPPELYSSTDHLSGFIELSSSPAPIPGIPGLVSPLGANLVDSAVTPLSFGFLDGINTITNSNATGALFSFSTDSLGVIRGWTVILTMDTDDEFGVSHRSRMESRKFGGTGGMDVVTDSLCDPDSTVDSCSVVGEGSYALVANSGVYGDWFGSEPFFVPEPGTLLLFGVGLAGIRVGGRKRAS